jgi:hypothetical protein
MPAHYSRSATVSLDADARSEEERRVVCDATRVTTGDAAKW